MNRLGDTSAFVIPAGQLLLTRRGKTRMYTVGIVFEFYTVPFNWLLLFDKNQWKHSGKYMLPLNPIWPPQDTPLGHNSVNAWSIFIIFVSIIRLYTL